ncbi:MAG: GNAT family N-acetyltransferase [Bacillota bacterium]
MIALTSGVQPLSPRQRAEAATLFEEAFAAAIPEPPPPDAVCLTREATVAATRLVHGFFGAAHDARWYGIGSGGRLVCAALITDSRPKLSLSSLVGCIRFLYGILRVFGWRGIHRIARDMKSKDPVELARIRAAFAARPGFLELHLIATRPDVQAQGLGGKMLSFLRAEAITVGYRGISLTTNPTSPAYRWYLEHGFVTEIEFRLVDMAACRMSLLLGC